MARYKAIAANFGVGRKPTKEDKLADARVDLAYRRHCSGVQISILDIPKIFAFGRAKVMEGADDTTLAGHIVSFVDSLRKN